MYRPYVIMYDQTMTLFILFNKSAVFFLVFGVKSARFVVKGKPHKGRYIKNTGRYNACLY